MDVKRICGRDDISGLQEEQVVRTVIHFDGPSLRDYVEKLNKVGLGVK